MATVTTRRSAGTSRQEPTSPVTDSGAASRATGYRTFSLKLLSGLHAFGGALLLAGGLGLHLRATRTAGGLAPEEVLRAWGFDVAEGWIVAAAGLLAIGGALAWRLRGLAPRAFAAATAVAGIALSLWRLQAVDERAAALVAGAEPSADFTSYHAGFGWGAWLLLLGSILLGLALITGGLRALDVRREGTS